MRLSDIKLLSGLAKEYLHDTIMGDGCPVKRLIGSGVIGVRDLPLHHLRRQVGTTRTTRACQLHIADALAHTLRVVIPLLGNRDR